MDRNNAAPLDTDRGLSFEVVAYDSDVAQQLIEEVQAEYVIRYGGRDSTPVDPAEFAPPAGIFLVGYLSGVPVATGAFRRLSDDTAEIKRMYVQSSARGLGLSRQVLAAIESAARAAGISRLILETGAKQPEAISLYETSGYLPIPGFGHYADAPDGKFFEKPL